MLIHSYSEKVAICDLSFFIEYLLVKELDMHITKTKSYNLFSITELKEHLSIDANDHRYDSQLLRVLKAAVNQAEAYIHEDIAITENVLTDYDISCTRYTINQPNVVINSISATTNNITTAIANFTVKKFSSYTLIKFDSYISVDELIIEYVTGYINCLPEDLKAAIFIKAAELFDIDRNGYVNNSIRESKAFNRILSHYVNFY